MKSAIALALLLVSTTSGKMFIEDDPITTETTETGEDIPKFIEGENTDGLDKAPTGFSFSPVSEDADGDNKSLLPGSTSNFMDSQPSRQGKMEDNFADSGPEKMLAFTSDPGPSKFAFAPGKTLPDSVDKIDIEDEENSTAEKFISPPRPSTIPSEVHEMILAGIENEVEEKKMNVTTHASASTNITTSTKNRLMNASSPTNKTRIEDSFNRTVMHVQVIPIRQSEMNSSGNYLEDILSNFTMPPTDLDQLGEWAENQTWPWEDGWEWPDKEDENPLCAKPRFMHGIFEQEGCSCNLTRWEDLQWQVPKNCKVFKGYNDCDSYEVTREKKLLSCEEHSYCQYAGRPKCVQYQEGKWLWETGATKLAASAAVAVAVASLL